MENLEKRRISPGTCELLSLWHGGQSSACYSLLSTGYGDEDTIKKASKELRSVQSKYNNKLSKEDQQELQNLILSLKKLISQE